MTANTDDQQMLTPLAAAVDVAASPAESLAATAALTAALDAVRRAAVARAREAGMSWQGVGEGLGVSKQSAQRRFTQEPDDTNPDREGVTPKEPRPARVDAPWEVVTRRGRVLLRLRRPAG